MAPVEIRESLNASLVYPRELFKAAILDNVADEAAMGEARKGG